MTNTPMMFDTDCPILKVRVHNGTTLPVGYVFPANPELTKFLYKLKDKRPKWEFIANYSYGYMSNSPSECNVYQDKQDLGVVAVERFDHKKGTHRICYNNKRLSDARTRGWTNRSCDERKAMREILKAFYPKTSIELMREAASHASGKVSSAIHGARMSFTRAFDAVFTLNRDALFTNWDTIRPMLPVSKDVDMLPDLYATHKQTDGVVTAMGTNHYHFVLYEGDKYNVANDMRAGDKLEIVTSYTDDTLPDDLRRGLGVLKLTDIGTLVPEFGMRTAEDAYFILKETAE